MTSSSSVLKIHGSNCFVYLTFFQFFVQQNDKSNKLAPKISKPPEKVYTANSPSFVKVEKCSDFKRCKSTRALVRTGSRVSLDPSILKLYAFEPVNFGTFCYTTT